MIAFRVVSGVTDHFIQRLPEWASTTILLLFGTTLLEPGDTFASSPSFAAMAGWASERTWGFALVGVAGVRLLALIANGTWPHLAPWSVRVRALGATLCMFAWFMLAFGFWLSNPGSTGAKTYACLLFVDFIIAIHVAGQAGKLDRRRRLNGDA